MLLYTEQSTHSQSRPVDHRGCQASPILYFMRQMDPKGRIHNIATCHDDNKSSRPMRPDEIINTHAD
eukprot:scaffold56768_cov23-Prasinocladus_malaysianus.AAC.1